LTNQSLKPAMEHIDKKEAESFEKSYEFRVFVEVLHSRYPSLTVEQINRALEDCLRQVSSPALREDLIACMRSKLVIKAW